ncbi:MAG TPA: hypothetical protein VK982_09125 [Bacteroidales bacterium]|nr:hypothetical protein [Bacteroidales bacterium]
MQLGRIIEITETKLGNKYFYTDLGEQEKTINVKIYLVPESMSESRISVQTWYHGEPEPVPECKVKDSRLLAEYSLSIEEDSMVKFICNELKEV